MQSKSDRRWGEYYRLTAGKPPAKLVGKALDYVEHRNRAIDIGGGALRDARYLLEQGFEVDVVDSSELMAREAEKIKSAKLHAVVAPFAGFSFPKNTFDLANAAYSLSFNSPQTFDAVFDRIKQSLVKGGIFCGQLFGVRDGWSGREDMTFHTRLQALKLFRGFDVIYFREEEENTATANGEPKHWHVFHIIARRT